VKLPLFGVWTREREGGTNEMRLTLVFVAARGHWGFCCGTGTGGSEEETCGFPPDVKQILFYTFHLVNRRNSPLPMAPPNSNSCCPL